MAPRSLAEFSKELAALQGIRPHAIITTNYDQFLELVFPEYTPIVGQQIIRGQALSVGEIFKVHGCVSSPDTLVFTKEDYDEFTRRKKYLTAKLLTFFIEHPVVFVGYSATDPNIRAILADIDEALPEKNGVIDNVIIVEWSGAAQSENPAPERLIDVDGSRGVRVRAIEATEFEWIFQAFGATNFNPKISAKLLRSLMVRSYDLVRTDIPRKSLQADFALLEHALDNSSEFAKLFGISTIADPSVISARYPYILKTVATNLGLGTSTNKALRLIKSVKDAKGFDLKGSDNKYHCAVKYGRQVVHKYSEDALELLRKVKVGENYEL